MQREHPDDVAAILARCAFFPDEEDVARLVAAAHNGLLAPARQRRGGRPEIDDAAALAEMRLHVERGRSPWHAAILVARSRGGGHSVDSTAKRLLRKFSHETN